jgi:hypothetical protein
MIPLWKGKNPIYFGVINIIPFDNLYRRVYFVMHTFRIMWSSLLKIQYTELKLSCGNDPVVKKSIYSNGDLDLWPNDPRSLGQRSRSPLLWIELLTTDRFRTITLVLYIGSFPNLATWFPCGRGRTLFILGFYTPIQLQNKKCVHHKIRPSI